MDECVFRPVLDNDEQPENIINIRDDEINEEKV
jgi:hypothetical protein